MIPLKLSIQNFLSYGPTTQTIDFTPYKLICLSGKNGHGKSALLDAITWALWGQARKATATSKPDQGLLRLGQTDMVVCLDFIFNGCGYRVRRMFSTKYGKPSAHVDFGTYNTETGAYAAFTEKTIRKTQQKIEQTIGLDYEAFINSSFLRQGQANEFSKKLPKERKDVLASILGLNRYEKVKKQALEKVRILSQEKETLAKVNEHLAKEREQLPLVQEKLHILETELTGLSTREQELVSEKQQLEVARTGLYKKQSDYKLVHLEHEQANKRLLQDTNSFKAAVQEWKTTHIQHVSLPDRKKLDREKKTLSEELSRCQIAYQEALEQKELFLGYKQKEQDLLSKLRQEHDQTLQDKKLALERLLAHQTVCLQKITDQEKTLTKLQTEQAACHKEIEQLGKTGDPALLINDTATLEKQFERQKTFYLKWMEEGKRSTQELQSLGHKQQLTHDVDNPSCPLCEQNLSQARKRFLSKKFEHQHTFLIHRIARLKALLAALKEAIEKQKTALSISKKTDELLHRQTGLSQSVSQQEKSLKMLQEEQQESEAKIKSFKTELQSAQVKAVEDLAHNREFQDLKKLIDASQELLQKSVSLPAHLKEVTEKHAQLHTQLQNWDSLDEQRVVQKERRKAVRELSHQIRNHERFAQEIEKRLAPFADLPAEETDLSYKETTHLATWQQLVSRKNYLLQEKGKLEAELSKLEQQGLQYKQFEEQSRKLVHDLADYQTIAQAFGKDGIQALLIEDALPEIEQEANDLLSRLSDNQAHIFIESLRDLKKGGVKETLDINISDNSGIRPYEMFSGGEAFRIDFSLRIAISKLLARRAGTSLQTLIIDEGFGSQDDEGLSRMMDCLYKIQDDFEKIIIVSHLASMKDQFPVHFYIEKGPHGSCATVKEQG